VAALLVAKIVLEHLIPAWWRMGGFLPATRHLWGDMVWPHFWAIQLWLIVLIFVYCATRELVRAIGRQQVQMMFFGAPLAARP